METEVTQPAIFAVSAAAWAVLEEAGVHPVAAAGLSVGEYAAVLAAGAADVAPLAALVRRRGQYMQEAVPLGQGAMAAVMGLSAEQVEALCTEALGQLHAAGEPAPSGGWVLTPANLNAPGQVVISGHARAVDRAVALAPQRGARRVQRLAVSAPFHCALMRPAEERLAPGVAALGLREARIPVVRNVDAEPVRAARDLAQGLVQQVSRPVQWERCVRRLAELGCDTFVEVGPGQTLSGLIRRTLPGARALSAGDAAGVAECLRVLAA